MTTETTKSLRVTGSLALSTLIILIGGLVSDLLFPEQARGLIDPDRIWHGLETTSEVALILCAPAIAVSLLIGALTRGSRTVAVIHESVAALAGIIAATRVIVSNANRPSIDYFVAGGTFTPPEHTAILFITSMVAALVLIIPLALRVFLRRSA